MDLEPLDKEIMAELVAVAHMVVAEVLVQLVEMRQDQVLVVAALAPHLLLQDLLSLVEAAAVAVV